MKDEHYFEIVINELKSGNFRPGLRAKAFADANGEESKAQALYLKYRVAQLIQEELKALQAQAAKDAQYTNQQWATEESIRKAKAQAEGVTLIHFILTGLVILVLSLVAWKFLLGK